MENAKYVGLTIATIVVALALIFELFIVPKRAASAAPTMVTGRASRTA